MDIYEMSKSQPRTLSWHLNRFTISQECIPVGCVPSATVAFSGGVCLGGVCPGRCLPREGGVYPGGVCPRCLPRGGCLRGGLEYTPPVNRMTDRCKNITFPQLRLWTVQIFITSLFWIFPYYYLGWLWYSQLPNSICGSSCIGAISQCTGKIQMPLLSL